MLLSSVRTAVIPLLVGLIPWILAAPSSCASAEVPVNAPGKDTTSGDNLHQGVVWTPPEAPERALQELDRMHRWGANAVRLTRFPSSDTLYTRADSLGLALYVDLPVAHIGGHAMDETLRRVRPYLERVHASAREHPSIQFIGLAKYGDTTVPVACSTLTRWTNRIHKMDPPLKTYYVTPFRARTDACATSVDRPLVAVQGRSAPVEHWQHWNEKRETAGIGALGLWTEPTAQRGLQVPHSNERQARHLETALSRLLASPQPPALFVYRWSDRGGSLLPWRTYGLVDSSGTPTPAGRVVRGFYTDQQRVFAFPSGTASTAHPVGVILFGWAIVGLLAGLYARSPFFRQTAFRYFWAHGFYLDAVQQGREVSTATNGLLLLLGSGTLGVITTIGTTLLRRQPGIELGIAALPSSLQSTLVSALANPVVAGILVAVAALGLLGLWIGVLTVAAQWTARFSMGQALMLVIWPLWPVLLGGVVALVAATVPPVALETLALLLFVALIGTAVSTTIRVLYDYWTITDTPLPVVALLVLPSPLALLVVGLTFIYVRYDVPTVLLQHLLTRT